MSVLHFTLSIGTSALELPRTILLACNLVAEVATLTRSRQATNSIESGIDAHTINAVRKYITAFA
jgi:hypothetical protein